MKTFYHDFIKIPGSITVLDSPLGRRYETPEGIFPSVTSVTGWQKRSFFAGWRKKNPEESRRVLSRGTAMHSMIESYLLNTLTPQTLKEQAGVCHTDLFLQMQSDIDRIGKIRSIEAPLWSKQIGLAGRTDCIGEYDGKLSVIDFKSASKPKSEDGILEYLTQATAYALMWQARTGQPVPNISIIIGVETGECQVFQTNPREHVADLVEAIAIWRADQEFSVTK
jgi:genome maintenance exonuclease 1